MSIRIEPDQICVKGSWVATDMGDALVMQDDDGQLWELVAVDPGVTRPYVEPS